MSRHAGRPIRGGAPARFAAPVGTTPHQPQAAPESQPVQLDNVIRQPEAFTPLHSVEAVTVEDLDRLWDWVRADREGTTGFLGAAHPNSSSFFQQVGAFAEQERNAAAWFRAIKHRGTLVGFIALVFANQSASVSLYIEPSSRDQIAAIVSDVLSAIPTQRALVVVTTDDQLIDAFDAAGFQKKTVLTRPSSTGVARDGI